MKQGEGTARCAAPRLERRGLLHSAWRAARANVRRARVGSEPQRTGAPATNTSEGAAQPTAQRGTAPRVHSSCTSGGPAIGSAPLSCAHLCARTPKSSPPANHCPAALNQAAPVRSRGWAVQTARLCCTPANRSGGARAQQCAGVYRRKSRLVVGPTRSTGLLEGHGAPPDNAGCWQLVGGGT